MTETLANGYSFESSQRELSDECQHDRVQMFFKNLCVLVLWIKVASALERLNLKKIAKLLASHFSVFQVDPEIRFTARATRWVDIRRPPNCW